MEKADQRAALYFFRSYQYRHASTTHLVNALSAWCFGMHSSRCLFQKLAPAKAMTLKYLSPISFQLAVDFQQRKLVYTLLSISDICNMVSKLKFYLQLSHNNELCVGSWQANRKLFSASRNHESTRIIFMDIHKEMSIGSVKLNAASLQSFQLQFEGLVLAYSSEQCPDEKCLWKTA